jgi:hypothetical protein
LPAIDEPSGDDLSRAILSEIRHAHEDFNDHAIWMARRIGWIGGSIFAVLFVCALVLVVVLVTKFGLIQALQQNTASISANTNGLREQQRLSRLLDSELALQNERQRVLLEHLNVAEIKIENQQQKQGRRR